MTTHAGALLGPDYVIPDEERPLPQRRESFSELLARLSHLSVVKHFDAYADIDWDGEEFRIDPDDPRWALWLGEGLGATAWYQAQPPGVRSRLGLHLIASAMKVGLEFESVLKRGLLEFASTLPNGALEFRYVYHEVIEEAQHSLMFQEFVNRSGLEVPGLPALMRFGSRQVARFGRTFPELFFIFVLGGEDPIDYVQRSVLRSGKEVHPLVRRIMQIHITEEARHICFAREYLRHHVPQLSVAGKLMLTVRAPMILATMAATMMRPSGYVVSHYGIPADVVAEAYTNNPQHRAHTLAALAKVRDLCRELAIVTPASAWFWQRLGIWDA